MQHFENSQAALAYIKTELLATLGDDLERQEGPERQHYEDSERQEMRARIADLESIMPRLCVTEGRPIVPAGAVVECVNLHPVLEFMRDGESMQEHCDNPDDIPPQGARLLWNVWVRINPNDGVERFRDLADYEAIFDSQVGARFYAETLASQFNVDLEEY